MGIYTALYFADVFTFEDGLQILQCQHKLMQSVAGKADYGMGTIIGLNYPEVDCIVSSQNRAVEMINVNNRMGTVISGKREQVKEVLWILERMGALKACMLPLFFPYHTKFAQNAALQYRQDLNQIDIGSPRVQIISPITRKVIRSKAELIDLLADNLCKNINWMATMDVMVRSGFTQFIERGPGNCLKTIGRFIEGNIEV